MSDFEQDPDTGIWRPRRRTFIILLGTAMVGTVLGPGVWSHETVQEIQEAFPGVGLFDAARFLKDHYGKGWYVSGGKKVWRKEIAEANRDRGRTAEAGGKIIRPRDPMEGWIESKK